MNSEKIDGQTNEVTVIHILKQIVDCIDSVKKSEFTAKRELAITVTKLEEAHLWLQEVIRREME